MQLITLALISLAMLAGDNNTNLGGVWVLDTTKSDFEEFDAPKQIVLKVEQSQDRLTVVEVSRDQHGKAVLKRDYTLHGREGPLGETTVFHNSARHEKWTLVQGGRELVIKRSIGCDGSVRLVFKRSTRGFEAR
jgi:hypothetical protein